ncbi:hypothetical protein PGQ11_012595 [Apiospora arundinis]|uniref:Secreted protein n=1 Tax=Apiospora arundinis TaxID=335852 RepID=A0ABR2I3K3_9PEZI
MAVAVLMVPGSYAWPPQGSCWYNGECIANDTWYSIRGRAVHEPCLDPNTENIHYGECKYWTNAIGGIFVGTCQDLENGALGCV